MNNDLEKKSSFVVDSDDGARQTCRQDGRTVFTTYGVNIRCVVSVCDKWIETNRIGTNEFDDKKDEQLMFLSDRVEVWRLSISSAQLDSTCGVCKMIVALSDLCSPVTLERFRSVTPPV